MDINGSTMLITGASQGVGRRLALHFAQRGARMILTARREDALRETARLAGTKPGDCFCHVADLCDPASLAAFAKRIENDGRVVDVLINNAADVTSKPLLESTPDDIDRLVRTNVIGCLQLCRLIVPGMVARGRGTIVNISSLAGYKPNPNQTAYSVSKAAVNGISEALRAELAPKGVCVMNVALASIALPECLPKPGQVSVAIFAQRLEAAILREETELFLSPVTKWLMRLYRFYPPLARLR